MLVRNPQFRQMLPQQDLRYDVIRETQFVDPRLPIFSREYGYHHSSLAPVHHQIDSRAAAVQRQPTFLQAEAMLHATSVLRHLAEALCNHAQSQSHIPRRPAP